MSGQGNVRDLGRAGRIDDGDAASPISDQGCPVVASTRTLSASSPRSTVPAGAKVVAVYRRTLPSPALATTIRSRAGRYPIPWGSFRPVIRLERFRLVMSTLSTVPLPSSATNRRSCAKSIAM
ncbi:hypothetical protein [Nitrospirillum iridis]|uniref:Uncharacterized protein n=1 Tax=Nitrospirillum iridis TaxID=765888 RepID=A0A7X0EFL8_9PROT|nr:hypothetical protein [Nitrospirillum iridis]MBB6255162.1 hypothetical protein [Nitrospirillum iridis]